MALLIDDAKIEQVQRAYGLTKLGFLPLQPARRLPKAYEAWEEIVRRLPELNKTARTREAIDAMPCLDLAPLKDDEVSRALLGLATTLIVTCARRR